MCCFHFIRLKHQWKLLLEISCAGHKALVGHMKQLLDIAVMPSNRTANATNSPSTEACWLKLGRCGSRSSHYNCIHILIWSLLPVHHSLSVMDSIIVPWLMDGTDGTRPQFSSHWFFKKEIRNLFRCFYTGLRELLICQDQVCSGVTTCHWQVTVTF